MRWISGFIKTSRALQRAGLVPSGSRSNAANRRRDGGGKTPQKWGKTPVNTATVDRRHRQSIHTGRRLTQPSHESYTYAVGGFDLACIGSPAMSIHTHPSLGTAAGPAGPHAWIGRRRTRAGSTGTTAGSPRACSTRSPPQPYASSSGIAARRTSRRSHRSATSSSTTAGRSRGWPSTRTSGSARPTWRGASTCAGRSNRWSRPCLDCR